MPKPEKLPRGQHYVPRMLQGPFTSPGRGKFPQVHVFDKQQDRTFQTAPENVLHERDFNTFDAGDYVVTLERSMGKIEDQAAPIFAKIIAQHSLAKLSLVERVAVMAFVALQNIRGVSTRASMLHVDEQIRERLRSEGHDPEVIPQLKGGNDPQQVKLTAMKLASDNLPAFTKSFGDKAMLLIEAAPGTTFLLGDNPVVMANQRTDEFRSTLGLMCEGIEIYMPIAPELALAFWCQSNVATLEEGLARSEESLRKYGAVALLGVGPDADKVRELHADLKTRIPRLKADVEAIREQRPLQSVPENMDFYNSLQVVYAERYIISSTGDFSLARSMIANDTKVRTGLRMELA